LVGLPVRAIWFDPVMRPSRTVAIDRRLRFGLQIEKSKKRRKISSLMSIQFAINARSRR
jgi:hypothetical protein